MKTKQTFQAKLAFLPYAVGICMALPLSAGSISITNPSFETNIEIPGGYTTNATGWTSSSLTLASTFRPDSTQLSGGPQDGVNVLALEGADVYQVLTSFLTANTLYTLQIGVGSRSDGLFVTTYAVDLESSNGTVLASVKSPTPAPGKFVTANLTYSALATDPNLGQNLVIRLLNTDPNMTESQVLFDNVRLSGVSTGAPQAPEPSTILLGAAGLAILGYCRRIPLKLLCSKLRSGAPAGSSDIRN
jgi:hypothetical protein